MKNHVIEKFDLSGDTAVSVKELNLYYGNFHALKSIYLDFPKKMLLLSSQHRELMIFPLDSFTKRVLRFNFIFSMTTAICTVFPTGKN